MRRISSFASPRIKSNVYGDNYFKVLIFEFKFTHFAICMGGTWCLKGYIVCEQENANSAIYEISVIFLTFARKLFIE